MSKYVKIASVQFSTRAVAKTREAGKIILGELQDVYKRLAGYGVDLAVFSEGVESCGQTNDNAENPDKPGPFLKSYQAFARSERCHVAGSLRTIRNGRIHNSMAFISAKGEIIGIYDKVNLTTWELDAGFTPGAGAVVVDSAIGRLGGVICFDLNFDNVLTQYKQLKPDILAFASMYHGGLRQACWAYQCRAFFVSALPFMGCGILDPFGRELATTHCYKTIALATVNLDRAMVHLDLNWDKFADIEHKYGNQVAVEIPANIAPALIYSLTAKRTALDIVREFGLELLDDYLERSTRRNDQARGGPALAAPPQRARHLRKQR